jgi:hypothetical protein
MACRRPLEGILLVKAILLSKWPFERSLKGLYRPAEGL